MDEIQADIIDGDDCGPEPLEIRRIGLEVLTLSLTDRISEWEKERLLSLKRQKELKHLQSKLDDLTSTWEKVHQVSLQRQDELEKAFETTMLFR